LGGILVPLAMPPFERGNHSPAGISRLNHCIDIAALGGNVGVGEPFPGIGGTHRRPLGSGQHLATLRHGQFNGNQTFQAVSGGGSWQIPVG
jgi:hypothetical protein